MFWQQVTGCIPFPNLCCWCDWLLFVIESLHHPSDTMSKKKPAADNHYKKNVVWYLSCLVIWKTRAPHGRILFIVLWGVGRIMHIPLAFLDGNIRRQHYAYWWAPSAFGAHCEDLPTEICRWGRRWCWKSSILSICERPPRHSFETIMEFKVRRLWLLDKSWVTKSTSKKSQITLN